MEEFFLGALFARNKLHIIEEQHIGRAVTFAEHGRRPVADGVNQIVGERFRRDVNDA